MREFTLPLTQDFLLRGLRPDYRLPNNTGYLSECFNLKVIDAGLVGYDPILIPFSDATLDGFGINIDWPFPQLFKGKQYTFLVTRTELFIVNEEDWSLYPVTLNSTVQSGGQWQFIDFGHTWLLVNGMSVIYHSNIHPTKNETDVFYVNNNIRLQAGCAHRGRAFLGGFDPSYSWSASWKSFYNDWATRTSSDIDFPIEGITSNSVYFTSIGGGDLLFLFDFLKGRDGYISSDYSSTDPYIFDMMRRNDAGIIQMDWQGTIYKILPLQDDVVVYGSGGATLLRRAGTAIGRVELPEIIGIPYPTAVGGSDDTHILVDNEGSLWRISVGSKPEKLGYKEFLTDILGGDITISYDKNDNEFYICSEGRSFILTNKGFSEHDQLITSIINSQGYRLGMCNSYLDDAFDKRWKIKTTPIDMGSVEFKRSTGMDISVDNEQYPGSVTGKTFFKNAFNKDYSSNTSTPMNKQGMIYNRAAGRDFMYYLEGSDFRNIIINSLNVKFQKHDRRFTRGITIGV